MAVSSAGTLLAASTEITRYAVGGIWYFAISAETAACDASPGTMPSVLPSSSFGEVSFGPSVIAPFGPRGVVFATMMSGAPFDAAMAITPASAKPNRSEPAATACTVPPEPLPGLTARSSPSSA